MIDNVKFTPDLKFSTISNIFYGSSNKKDLKLCREIDYEYYIPEEFDLAPILQSNNGTIPLVHSAGALPPLNLFIRCYDEGIMNVNWSW